MEAPWRHFPWCHLVGVELAGVPRPSCTWRGKVWDEFYIGVIGETEVRYRREPNWSTGNLHYHRTDGKSRAPADCGVIHLASDTNWKEAGSELVNVPPANYAILPYYYPTPYHILLTPPHI